MKLKASEERISKYWVEINETEHRKTTENISETRSWFCEKLNETDKPSQTKPLACEPTD